MFEAFAAYSVVQCNISKSKLNSCPYLWPSNSQAGICMYVLLRAQTYLWFSCFKKFKKKLGCYDPSFISHIGWSTVCICGLMWSSHTFSLTTMYYASIILIMWRRHLILNKNCIDLTILKSMRICLIFFYFYML